MAIVVAPENLHVINALPDALKNEFQQRFDALMQLASADQWASPAQQLQLIDVIIASPFSAHVFLLNPHLLDHSFLVVALSKNQLQDFLFEAMAKVTNEKQLHQCLRRFRKAHQVRLIWRNRCV